MKEKESINISFNEPKTIDISIEKNEQEITFENPDTVVMSILKIPKKHSDLKGLDYESSGHTGFASSKQLEEYKKEIRTIQFSFQQEINQQLNSTMSILDEKVPKRLNDIPTINVNSSEQYIYIDNKGRDGKISIKEMNSRLLRSVKEVPNDMETNTYIFLEKGEK